jgi:NAD+ kinase
MYSGDALVIKGATIGARLIHQKEQNYFAVLKEKLSWGDKK